MPGGYRWVLLVLLVILVVLGGLTVRGEAVLADGDRLPPQLQPHHCPRRLGVQRLHLGGGGRPPTSLRDPPPI